MSNNTKTIFVVACLVGSFVLGIVTLNYYLMSESMKNAREYRMDRLEQMLK